MRENCGGTVKKIAVGVCVIGIIASLFVGFPFISESSRYNPTSTTGWIIIIAGSAASILSAILMYGFGELIEMTGENNDALVKIEKKLAALNAKSGAEKENRLEEVRRNTEEATRVEEVRKPAEEQEQRKAPEAKNAQGVPSYPHTLEYYEGICPNCGLKHYNYVHSLCVRCGAKFASREN